MRTTKKAIFLILLASLSAGTGQLFWKRASFNLSLEFISLINPFLIVGVLLYFLGTVFMVLAFREGELSVLHPFLATSYLWVVIVSALIFPTETITIRKMLGVILIFLGVSSISIGGDK